MERVYLNRVEKKRAIIEQNRLENLINAINKHKAKEDLKLWTETPQPTRLETLLKSSGDDIPSPTANPPKPIVENPQNYFENILNEIAKCFTFLNKSIHSIFSSPQTNEVKLSKEEKINNQTWTQRVMEGGNGGRQTRGNGGRQTRGGGGRQ
ncbi:MAG: hypothetical protein EBT63_01415 [Proteobacteria bacterium]|nr:hypothetical protein [Pseudomonadota bacterium]